jgi:hypothetical protein
MNGGASLTGSEIWEDDAHVERLGADVFVLDLGALRLELRGVQRRGDAIVGRLDLFDRGLVDFGVAPINADGLLVGGLRLDLGSPASRLSCAKHLAARVGVGGMDWLAVLDRFAQGVEIHFSGAGVPSGGMNALPFRTARDLVATMPEALRWAVHAYVPLGGLVELVGKAKSAGKTTWLLYLAAALVNHEPFLGHATRGGPVVFLSEQPGPSLRAALRRTGLAECTDLVILSWRDTRGATWPDIVAAAFAECRQLGAVLLVVDTLPAFAGLRGDAENDAGTALEAIAPVQEGMRDDLAVIVVRHERKMGGDVGDSARGSSAFTGAVDVVLRLSRKVDAQRPTIRTLAALSRFDETPPELIIELTDAGYVALGDEAAIALSEARSAVLAALVAGQSRTRVQLEAAALATCGGKPTTVQAAIAELLASGAVARSGSGHKGSPYHFALSSSGLSEGSEETPASAGDGASPNSSERFLRPYGVGASEERIFGAPRLPEDGYPASGRGDPQAAAWLAGPLPDEPLQ